MIFKDESGKIYEIPEDRYAEFEVKSERASEILADIKKCMLETNNIEDIEVKSYQDIVDNHLKLHNKKLNSIVLMTANDGEYKSAYIFY
ncbi:MULTISPECIES: hypothetical protein [Brachyspira]|uniref:hypothetical protein n=1 Tax=Brachyspira TaxID=29521 RepID=UPI0030052CA1